MEETFKDVHGYEGLYKISNYGRFMSIGRQYLSGANNNLKRTIKEKFITGRPSPNGYEIVNLYNKNKKTTSIHRLVALAFLENPYNLPQVNHKDGNKKNNRSDNLEWCTISENIRHAFRTGLKKPNRMIMTKKYGTDNFNSKKVHQLNNENEVIKTWPCVIEAANELNIKQGNIANCACGRQKTAHGYKWRYAA